MGTNNFGKITFLGRSAGNGLFSLVMRENVAPRDFWTSLPDGLGPLAEGSEIRLEWDDFKPPVDD